MKVRSILALTLATCCTLVVAAVAGADENSPPPTNSMATEAKARHDAALLKAEADFRNARIAADQQYRDALLKAFRVAMKAQHLDEANNIDAMRKEVETELAKLKSVVSEKQPHVINLMKFIELARDVRGGRWAFQNEGLRSDHSDFARIAIGYRPPEQYNLRVEFTCLEGNSAVTLIGSLDAHRLIWQMGASNNRAWELTPGLLEPPPAPLRNGRRHVAVVEVRKDVIRAYLDDQLMATRQVDLAKLDLPPRWRMKPTDLLGLGTVHSSTLFHRIELIEVDNAPDGAGSSSR